MDSYIGTKIVKAELMMSRDFYSLHKEGLPQSENKEGYKVEYEDGYVSWSPKEVFERCYRKITVSEKELIDPTLKIETLNTKF